MIWNKKKRIVPEENKVTSEYYKLHTKAVDDLVNADESNSPEVTEEELAKYRSGPKLKLPEAVRLVLIKMWFAGAVCFFIFWGLSPYVSARPDLLFIFGMALGIVTDLMTNNCIRFFARTKGANDRFMMFPSSRYVNFFLNILYAMLLLALTHTFYTLVNMALVAAGGKAFLGVEPILFGVVYTGFDLLLISLKHLAGQVVSDARRSVERSLGQGRQL